MADSEKPLNNQTWEVHQQNTAATYFIVVPSVGSPAEGRGWWDPQQSPRRFGHVYLLLFRSQTTSYCTQKT